MISYHFPKIHSQHFCLVLTLLLKSIVLLSIKLKSFCIVICLWCCFNVTKMSVKIHVKSVLNIYPKTIAIHKACSD